jgi:restriction system protein
MQRLGGDDFESFCAELLRRNGARVVEQGGAGDQGADLLIDWQRRRWVVQCKRLGRNVSNAAVQQAHAGRSYHGTEGAMVITNQGFTRSARELAARTDVELIDGQGLARLLRRAG